MTAGQRSNAAHRNDLMASSTTVIKKYANRRLYNTATGQTVTLGQLSQMVKAGEDFVVTDIQSDTDITRGVLTQIILQEESSGKSLFSTQFLRQLISFYDNDQQEILSYFLDQATNHLANNRETILKHILPTCDPYSIFDELCKLNTRNAENVMNFAHPSLFFPSKIADINSTQPSSKDTRDKNQEIGLLQLQLINMRKQIDQILDQRYATKVKKNENEAE
jgi:polyhydroxyalkanoate synthesis repressor PhaR